MQTKAKRSGWDLTVILFLAVPLDSNIDLRNTHAEVVGSNNSTWSIFICAGTTVLFRAHYRLLSDKFGHEDAIPKCVNV